MKEIEEILKRYSGTKKKVITKVIVNPVIEKLDSWGFEYKLMTGLGLPLIHICFKVWSVR